MLPPPRFCLPLRKAGKQSGILSHWEQGSSPAQGDFHLPSLWNRSLHCTKRDIAFYQARSPALRNPVAQRYEGTAPQGDAITF